MILDERGVALMYRRKWGTAVWHTCPDCSFWPGSLQSEERDRTPHNGQLCRECQGLERGESRMRSMRKDLAEEQLGPIMRRM